MSTSTSKNVRAGLGSRAFFRKVGALLASTALLVSTNLTTAALAEARGGRGPALPTVRVSQSWCRPARTQTDVQGSVECAKGLR